MKASNRSSVMKQVFDVKVNNLKHEMTLNIWDTPGGDNFANMKDFDYK